MILTIEEVLQEEGKNPDYRLDSENYERMNTDDIADEYLIFFNKEALGGCIVYASYDRGTTWSVNPNLRFPVYYLLKKILNK